MTSSAGCVLSIAALTEFAQALLRAVGTPPGSSDRVADGLVGSDVAGVATHGVRVLPHYLSAVERGEIDPAGRPTIERETPTSAIVKGGWTFGHVGAAVATETAISKALASGVALVGLVESHHIGRLGEYVEMAARSGIVLSVWGGGQGARRPAAAPHGGRQAVLHTNPIAIGIPAQPSGPMVLDIATTVVAGGKVDMARERGEPIPPGLLLDRTGEPTTDPSAYFTGGALLPFGGHKGFGLMLAAELIGRVLLGADDHVSERYGGPIHGQSGTAFAAWRCDLFIDRQTFEDRADALLERVRAVPPQDPLGRVRVPGDPESEARARAYSDGVRLSGGTWHALTEVADRLGVTVPA